MTWSLIIIDDGITDDAQARAGKQTAIEYDYYFDFPDTDDGISDTHGDRYVFLTEAGCRHYVRRLRWPEGFVCRRCGAIGEPWEPRVGFFTAAHVLERRR